MNTKGIARRIDDLGRFVIPKEMRNSLGIENGDLVEAILTENGILLKPCNQDVKERNSMLLTLKRTFNACTKKYNYNILFFEQTGKRISFSNITKEYDHKLSEKVKNFLKTHEGFPDNYEYDEDNNLFIRVDCSLNKDNNMNVCAYIENKSKNNNETEKEFIMNIMNTLIITYKNYMINKI